MKCFTFFHGELLEGIQTTLSHNNNRVIFLGMKGPRCHFDTIYLGSSDEKEDSIYPKIDKNGLINKAYPTTRDRMIKFNNGVTKKVKKVILKNAYDSQTKVLLRINTSTPSKIPINGRWQEKGGWPEELLKTNGFSKVDDGKWQRWCDDLVILDDQDVILITPAGSRRNERMIIRNELGELLVIPEVEYYKILKSHQKEMLTKIEKNEEKEAKTPENIETVSETDEVEKGKASQNAIVTEIHTEEGETIGA